MNLDIDRIVHPERRSGDSPHHQARLVVPPGDFEATSPFLLMAEDWFSPPAGFPEHPHRGLQTVTIVLEGSLEHRDHTGGHGVLSAGDVQWMTLRGGVRFEGDDTAAEAEDVVWFRVAPDCGERVVLGVEADAPSRFLFFASPVIDEPVVAHGPFVMNSVEQVHQAYEDYRSGRLTG